jgi:NAD(P)-dependent dehydrogenase (short-subunit alcohol dehydrogenase family)
MRLLGKNAIITGANQGFGKALAEKYVTEGASVVICARDLQKLTEVKITLEQMATNNQKVISIQADVSSEADVKNLIEQSLYELGTIDVLVNNAGIYGPKGSIEDIVWSEWVKAMEVNVYGPLLTSRAILPHMKENKYGKIINLSGGGATTPMPGLSAYAASKAAIVRITETLALETKDFHIDINAVAPGALNTRLLEEVLAAGPDLVGKEFYEKSLKQRDSGGTSMDKGTSLCVFLASSESDGITGKLISAVWDPWKDFEKHKNKIASSDIYTLRRIVPEDRGENWGI